MRHGARNGFTLMEVCLVMLIFAIAISTILAFFPVALRQANSAVTDSVVTTFADNVINALQANAARMTWKEWSDTSAKGFRKIVTSGITLNVKGGNRALKYESDETLENYLGVDGSTIKYRLDFPDNPKNPEERVRQITLYVTDNKHGSPKNGNTFVSHVVYLGKVPE